MARKPPPSLLLLLCVIWAPALGDGESCSADQKCGTERRRSEALYSEAANKAMPQRWASYLQEIAAAKAAYRPCNLTACGCVSERLAKDLVPWQEAGISRELVRKALEESGGGVLYQVVSGKLYRSKSCRFPSRCDGIEHFLLQELRHLPDLEFVLNDSDYPQSSVRHYPPLLPIFSFSKAHEHYADILFPAWSFWAGGPVLNSFYPQGIGRWDKLRAELRKVATEQFPWVKKTTRAFFRGSRTAADRDPLVLLSRGAPDLVDAAYTKNQAWRSPEDTLGAQPAPEVSLKDHCRFKFLFNYRGVAASFRLRHVLLCGSAVFHVGTQWVEFFYDGLRPWVHFVPVPSHADRAELRSLLEFAQAHDDVIREIGERGAEFVWRHLDMDHVACYWRRLLRRYARLLRYKVILEADAVRISR